MGKRKVSILEPAATAVAEVAWFIENKGLPQTAKKFVTEAFLARVGVPLRNVATAVWSPTNGSKHPYFNYRKVRLQKTIS